MKHFQIKKKTYVYKFVNLIFYLTLELNKLYKLKNN